MVSALAKGDFEDMVADGLRPTLEDFDRLNQLALRLTDGAETTPANFPRVGWAGDTPFYQPTCAALAWYLENVDRADFGVQTKDACWFFALAHARTPDAFVNLAAPAVIRLAVNRWLATLPVTRDEIARACRFAASGFDDASPAKPDSAKARDAAKTETDRREESLASISEAVTATSSLTGIPPASLKSETPSRLKAMVDAVKWLHNRQDGSEISRLRADYDLTYREIRRRLSASSSDTLVNTSSCSVPGAPALGEVPA